MTKKIWVMAILFLALVADVQAKAAARAAGPSFKKVFTIILENESKVAAIQQPFLKKLADEGAFLEDLHGVAHPSYPNYIALTSGSTWNLGSDRQVTLDVTHIGDLLEAKGKTWRVYAEGYTGTATECMLKSGVGRYARKHVPFLSYKNVQVSPERCSHVVNADRLAGDIEEGKLADYTLYIPDDYNNGHDTGVGYADKWLAKTFAPLLKDRRFTDGMLLIVTFDEDDYSHDNQIYGAFWGDSVVAGTRSKARYDLYSILRTVEDVFELGSLGRADAKATSVTGIWR